MYNKRSIKKHITKNTTVYVPVYVEKYKGRPPILCRSSWEEAFCRWADHSHGIIEWSSEEICITYPDPIDPIMNNKPHYRRYFPDFVIKTEKGEIFLIEIKPEKETRPPKDTGNKKRSTLITEQKNWLLNRAKWKAAEQYCNRLGWKFKIITERELFGKK